MHHDPAKRLSCFGASIFVSEIQKNKTTLDVLNQLQATAQVLHRALNGEEAKQ